MALTLSRSAQLGFNHNLFEEHYGYIYNDFMTYTYPEALKRFGSYYRIKRAMAEGKLYSWGHGLYSEEKPRRDEVTIALAHPKMIFTLESAFYLYGFTDVIPEVYTLASPLGYTWLKEKDIRQNFQKKGLFPLGASHLDLANGTIRIYDKERLLIELFRYQKRFPYDYYKGIIAAYRKQAPTLDTIKLADYASHFAYGDALLKRILREVF
jgi:hypothetical protein